MDINHYLEPYKYAFKSRIPGLSERESLGSSVSFFNGEREWFNNFDYNIVILGVPESRNAAGNESCAGAPSEIRKWLFSLRENNSSIKIADVGDVRGNSLNDRYQALKELIAFFVSKSTTVILLGGSQDLSVPVYESLASETGKDLNIAVGDSMMDIDSSGQDFSSRSWLNFLSDKQGNAPNDIVLMGIQRYLTSSVQEKYFLKHCFEVVPLGDLRGENIKKIEPIIRDTDFFSLDFRMIKNQPQINNNILSPHGLEAYDACRLGRYAGFSERVRVFGVFEMPFHTIDFDNSPLLVAEMVWHFIEGYENRTNDYPVIPIENYKSFIVPFDGFDDGITFFSNPVNERWWMKLHNGQIVSCEKKDYSRALRKELPPKWWRFFQKDAGYHNNMQG